MGTRGVRRCETCFINILDQRPHRCIDHGIAAYRSRVYTTQTKPFFTFQMTGAMYQLDSRLKNFQLIANGQQLVSPATNGMLSFTIDGETVSASYDASLFKIFSIVFAKMIGNEWCSILRVQTTSTGIQLHKMPNVPIDINALKFNTIAVLGVEPKPTQVILSKLDFNVLANESGPIDKNPTSFLIADSTEIEVIVFSHSMQRNK